MTALATMTATRIDRTAMADLSATLAAADLPTTDLAEDNRTFFRFDDGALAGFGGIEGSGDDRLLRSVVVASNRRGAGLGRALLEQLEQCAIELGAKRLHLLTTTAATFFAANGYSICDRAAAPASIADTAEFRSLCPASATYLVKTLVP